MNTDSITSVVFGVVVILIVIGGYSSISKNIRLQEAVGEQAHKICLEEYSSLPLAEMPAKCLKYFKDE